MMKNCVCVSLVVMEICANKYSDTQAQAVAFKIVAGLRGTCIVLPISYSVQWITALTALTATFL